MHRLHDAELKIPADQDAFTTAELLSQLTGTIFAEVDSLPQGRLQQSQAGHQQPAPQSAADLPEAVGQHGAGQRGVPEDCQTVAYAELSGLNAKMKKVLENNPKLDTYTRAHLTESSERIGKVLEARWCRRRRSDWLTIAKCSRLTRWPRKITRRGADSLGDRLGIVKVSLPASFGRPARHSLPDAIA